MQACTASFCACQLGMHKAPPGWHAHGMQTNMQSRYACLHAKKINTGLEDVGTGTTQTALLKAVVRNREDLVALLLEDDRVDPE